jgi:excisionase family DNA binding protein
MRVKNFARDQVIANNAQQMAENLKAEASYQRDWIPRLLKIPEAAEILGVTTARAYALARNGTLPTIALGRQLRVSSAALQQFIAQGVKGLPEDK